VLLFAIVIVSLGWMHVSIRVLRRRMASSAPDAVLATS
jgi:hypothetical protein